MILKEYVIGVDIGGTKCAVVIGNILNQNLSSEFIQDKEVFQTGDYDGPMEVISQLCTVIRELLNKHSITLDRVLGIGISCGGPLDSEKGIILSPPNLIGWDEIRITDIFKDEFDLPCYLQNDANACALAEWKFGAARGLKHVIYLTYGTGMGAGLIIDGKLYNGACAMAGEVGHVRLDDNGPVGFGKAGSFEGFCSGSGIAQIARTLAFERLQMGQTVEYCKDISELNGITTKDVAIAAKAGDELAQKVFEYSGKYLGKALAMLIDIINPEMIVCGSVFGRAKELLWPEAEKVLEKEALANSYRACRIVPSALGEYIGDYAAISVLLDRMESD